IERLLSRRRYLGTKEESTKRKNRSCGIQAALPHQTAIIAQDKDTHLYPRSFAPFAPIIMITLEFVFALLNLALSCVMETSLETFQKVFIVITVLIWFLSLDTPYDLFTLYPTPLWKGLHDQSNSTSQPSQ